MWASAICCRHFEVSVMKMKKRSNFKIVSSRHRAILAAFMVASMALAGAAQAQSADEAAGDAAGGDKASSMSSVPGEMDAIEQLYREDGAKSNEVIDDGPKKDSAATVQTKQGEVEVKGVADLSSLSEFKDIAVIQKRYLPKSGRFEGFGGLNGILNDKFFLSFGANLRLAYYFNERWAIEGQGMIISTAENSATKDLKKHGVQTINFVSPTNYYGADVKWTPLYGKMSFMNRKITPFDLYLSAGGGITNTNQGGSEPTIHFGTGQIFAFTKSAAFRWDFSWNFYSATSGVVGAKQNSTYNNLFLTVGASFFFPEATYR